MFQKKWLKKVSAVILAATLALPAGFTGFATQDSPHKASQYTTGLSLPTQKDLDWEKKNMIKTQQIKLNRIGLERMNKERKEKGLQEISSSQAVPIGYEVSDTPQNASLFGPGGSVSLLASSGPLPNQVDNSKLQYFPVVKNQYPFNSCATFSTTHYQMTHMTAMARGWNVKAEGDAKTFSPKYIYNMITSFPGEGTFQDQAYRVMMENGCAFWSNFPYDDNASTWCLDSNVWKNAANYRVDTFGFIDNMESQDSINYAKQLLVNGYILNFGTDIYGWNYGTIRDNPNSTSDTDEIGKDICIVSVRSDREDHAMNIVGYNDDIWCDIDGDNTVDDGEKGAFRVVNSWGPDWTPKSVNDGGFCWVSYDALKSRSSFPSVNYNERESLISRNQVYWLAAKENYTPKLLAKFTLNTTNRGGIQIRFGYSDTSSNTPAYSFQPYVFRGSGPNLAFDGTTTACDGTFYIDYSDLIKKYSLADGTSRRWYIEGSTTNNTPLAIKNFSLINPYTNQEMTIPGFTPLSTNGETIRTFITYALNSTPDSTPQNIPAPPANLKIKSGFNTINLTWDQVDTAAMYKVLVDDKEVYYTPTASYTYKLPTKSDNHSFKICSVNLYGQSQWIGPVSASSLDGGVSELEPMLSPRKDFEMAFLGNAVYALGGNNRTNILNSAEKFDTNTKIWSSLPAMPTARTNLGVVTLNGKIYSIGGNTAQGNSNTMDVFDPANGWSTPSSTLVTARNSFAAVSLNNKIYVLGGNNSTDILSSVEEYSLTNGAWSLLPQGLPTPRRALKAVAVGSKIYAIGGMGTTGLSRNIDVLDTATGNWTTLNTIIPEPIHSFTAASVNNKIYIIGGFNTSGSPSNKIFEYNPASNTWNTKAELPLSIYKTAAVPIADGKIIISGGSTSLDPLSCAYLFDPSADYWAALPVLTNPRILCKTVELNGKIYRVGGSNESQGSVITGITEVFNPSNNQWTRLDDLNTPRFRFGLAAANGKLYVIGGHDGNSEIASVEELDVSDPEATWVYKQGMPNPRKDLTAVSLNNKIYAIGGALGLDAFTTVEEYNPLADSWTPCPGMDMPRANPCAVSVNGKIYVVCGTSTAYAGNYYSFVKTLEVYDPIGKTWSTVGEISEGRSMANAVAVNNVIYILSGFNYTEPYACTKIEKYDVINNIWLPSDETLKKVMNCGIASIGNKIYVYGGIYFNDLNQGVASYANQVYTIGK
ncbi:MAG: hypothetical protein N2645_21105 [Clostridia bacterium]|nr:hypothetical protein [Clostridia bacterium]